MANFDPDTFLNATLSEPTAKRPPIPATDYVAVVKEVTSRSFQGVKDPSVTWFALDVVLSLEIPESIRRATGIEKSSLTVKDSIILDITANGSIDNAPGKNGKLGMYRNALDMNKKGDSFSPILMQGRTLLVKIKHDEYNGNIQEKVAAVAKLV